MEAQILPRLRERVEELRERVFRGERLTTRSSGQVQVGGGVILDRVRNVVRRARPGILPRISERVEEAVPRAGRMETTVTEREKLTSDV